MAEPMRASNSFVGTEEYIAPVSCPSGELLFKFYFTDRLINYRFSLLPFYRRSSLEQGILVPLIGGLSVILLS